MDSDNDGVGDNSDVFPNDGNESADTDGDGVGDNADAFPEDPSETKDSDGDGVGDNYQKQMEETRKMYIGIGTILGIMVLIAGLVYKQKGRSPFEEEKEVDFANLAEAPLVHNEPAVIAETPPVHSEPTVTQQWTDESGYTWRVMSNGDTMWWDGTDWKAYSSEHNEN